MDKDKKPVDFSGMGKMFQKAAEANPELFENINQEHHFEKEYPVELPELLSRVEDELDPLSREFFVMYNKLLQSYSEDSNGQFIIDFFCFGVNKFEMFKEPNNRTKITSAILLRGSQIRAARKQAGDISNEEFHKRYKKSVEAWALSDTLEIKYGSFLPVEVSQLLIELQVEAVK